MKFNTVLVFLAMSQFAFAEYSVTQIESLDPSYGESRPVSINENGQVVGWDMTPNGEIKKGPVL